MKRFYFTGVALVAALVLGNMASGEDAKPRAVATLSGSNYYWTGYWMLQSESVQKELGVTSEQKEKLKEIAEKAAAASKDDLKFDWAKFREMKSEEQQNIQKEMAARYASRAAESRKQVEQVLTPKQIEQLKEIEFRQRAASMLYMPQVLEQIGISDEQKQQLQKIREELQSKMMQLQRESQDKTLGVLTPEQTKKLKELTEKGLPGLGQPGQAAEQPKGK